jgi:hypothetical protein
MHTATVVIPITIRTAMDMATHMFIPILVGVDIGAAGVAGADTATVIEAMATVAGTGMVVATDMAIVAAMADTEHAVTPVGFAAIVADLADAATAVDLVVDTPVDSPGTAVVLEADTAAALAADTAAVAIANYT